MFSNVEVNQIKRPASPRVPEPGQDFMCHKGLFTREAFAAPAVFSMERQTGREEALRAVASVLVECMRAHVETVGVDGNHDKM